MAAFHPRVEDLPGEFPVFPLSGALLLPRGKLPLRIFEPRYMAMTEDSLGLGRMFGMIQPDPNGAEAELLNHCDAASASFTVRLVVCKLPSAELLKCTSASVTSRSVEKPVICT